MASEERVEASARERAGRTLRCQLAGGRWPPGTMLQENDLSRELGLSKTPVREALLALSEHGLIRPLARVGYLVPEIALRDVAEVFALRELLEARIAADVAATRAGAGGAADLDGTPPAQRERALHEQLAAMAGGPRMKAALGWLLDETDRMIAYLDPERGRSPLLLTEHVALLDAVVSNDPMLARALMTVHLSHMRESLMATLRQRLREQAELP